MDNKQSFLLGVLTCASSVVYFMNYIYTAPIPPKFELHKEYIEIEVPAHTPDFENEVLNITSTLNKSKLKHVLVYTYAMCQEYGVPYDLVKAVIQTESSWKHKAVSTSNAIGLMQVKPSTSLSEFKTPGGDLYDPYVNVTVGIKYLSKLHKRFGDWNTTLTAYSHGPTITSGYSDEYIASNFYVKKVGINKK